MWQVPRLPAAAEDPEKQGSQLKGDAVAVGEADKVDVLQRSREAVRALRRPPLASESGRHAWPGERISIGDWLASEIKTPSRSRRDGGKQKC